MVNCIAGANEKQFHLTGVQPGRDFQPAVTGDLRQITAEDRCPVLRRRVAAHRGY